jgi:hypothetical protein
MRSAMRPSRSARPVQGYGGLSGGGEPEESQTFFADPDRNAPALQHRYKPPER